MEYNAADPTSFPRTGGGSVPTPTNVIPRSATWRRWSWRSPGVTAGLGVQAIIGNNSLGRAHRRDASLPRW